MTTMSSFKRYVFFKLTAFASQNSMPTAGSVATRTPISLLGVFLNTDLSRSVSSFWFLTSMKQGGRLVFTCLIANSVFPRAKNIFTLRYKGPYSAFSSVLDSIRSNPLTVWEDFMPVSFMKLSKQFTASLSR